MFDKTTTCCLPDEMESARSTLPHFPSATFINFLKLVFVGWRAFQDTSISKMVLSTSWSLLFNSNCCILARVKPKYVANFCHSAPRESDNWRNSTSLKSMLILLLPTTLLTTSILSVSSTIPDYNYQTYTKAILYMRRRM